MSTRDHEHRHGQKRRRKRTHCAAAVSTCLAVLGRRVGAEVVGHRCVVGRHSPAAVERGLGDLTHRDGLSHFMGEDAKVQAVDAKVARVLDETKLVAPDAVRMWARALERQSIEVVRSLRRALGFALLGTL